MVSFTGHISICVFHKMRSKKKMFSPIYPSLSHCFHIDPLAYGFVIHQLPYTSLKNMWRLIIIFVSRLQYSDSKVYNCFGFQSNDISKFNFARKLGSAIYVTMRITNRVDRISTNWMLRFWYISIHLSQTWWWRENNMSAVFRSRT